MRLYTLRQPVGITGMTMFGFGTRHATCAPAESEIKGFDPLVFRKYDARLPLVLNAVSLKKRRMEARGLGYIIKAVEHWTPLRFLLPGMTILGTGEELPHFTCSGPLVRALMKEAVPIEVDVPYFTAKESCRWAYPGKRAGGTGFTAIEPSKDKKLRIKVTVNFKKFGKMTKECVFPDEKFLRLVLDVPSLGTPSWLEWPARLLWAHAHNTYWPKSGDNELILETIIMHRFLDILGALALLESPVEGGFPSLNVYSQCSGHLADHHVLKTINTVTL